MGKAENNKRAKKESLLNTAFTLFTSQGFQSTSISDITKQAGVAKGTFYLYFTDKYDLRNKLIAHKANDLFLDACRDLQISGVTGVEDQIIYLVNNLIDRLNNDKSLLRFLSKHLSWGVFRNTLISYKENEDGNAYQILMELLHSSGHQFKQAEVMIYMIIELTAGAIYNPILFEQPVSLDEIKPYVFESVRHQVQMHMV